MAPLQPVRRTTWILLFALAVSGFSIVLAAQNPTALDAYVNRADSSYRYELVRTVPGQDHTLYQLEMVSQTWRNGQEVDRPEWRHWLNVIRPEGAAGEIGFLYITGGNNQDVIPKSAGSMLLGLARQAKMVVAELRMVPNQHLTFTGLKPRKEDEIIAYTWDRFLKTGDTTWPAQLPMTKSAVRAMDTVSTFCRTAEGGSLKIDKFVVAGGSKRGWTTWLTAAVDRRVVAIIPCVIDVLNVKRSFEHHRQVYGFWAPSIKDYVEMGLMDIMNHPRWKGLMDIVDPLSYRQRLTMPKLLIHSSGDQFFLPDSSRFYFQDLLGEKYIRYIPNCDHSLKNTDVADSILSFLQSVMGKTVRPQFSWKFTGADTIRLQSRTPVQEVRLWQAGNPKARDFRLETLGAAWKSELLSDQGKGIYRGKVAKPKSGWTAFFLEVTYPGPGKAPFKFTSGVRIVPDTLPYAKPKSKK